MPFTPVTIYGKTYNTAQGLATYLDKTSYRQVEPLLPANFKFTMDVVNLLKTDNTGFLKNATKEFVQRLIADNTPSEFGTMTLGVFQSLSTFLTVQQRAVYLDQATVNQLRVPLPANLKIEAEVINLLKTDGTGFLGKISPDLAQKIFSSNTPEQLEIINKNTFQDILKLLPPQDLANFFDRTTYARVKNRLPANFKFSMNIVNLLKTSHTKFLQKGITGLGMRILEDNTAAELSTMTTEVFQNLQEVMMQQHYDAIPDSKMIDFLKTPKPKVGWGINVAKQLKPSILHALVNATPQVPNAEGFFAYLGHNALSFIDPAYFATFDTHIYKSIFAVPFFIDAAGDTFWATNAKTFQDLSRAQIQNINAKVLNELILEAATSGEPTLDKPYRVKLPAGFLKKLSTGQVMGITPHAFAQLYPAHYRYLKAQDLATILEQLSVRQVGALQDTVLEDILTDDVSQKLFQANKLKSFTDKVPVAKKQLLSNGFFLAESPSSLTDPDLAKLNIASTLAAQQGAADISVLNKLGPGDAKRFSTSSLFYKIIMDGTWLEYIPPLFFKGFSVDQAKGLSPNAVQRLSAPQIKALGSLVLQFSIPQLKVLDDAQIAAVREDIKLDFADLINLHRPLPSRLPHSRPVLPGRGVYSRLLKAADPDSFIAKIHRREIRSIVKEQWSGMSSVYRGKILTAIVRKGMPINNLFSREQLLQLNGAVLTEVIRGMGSLRLLANDIFTSPGYGPMVFRRLFETGVFDVAYQYMADKRAKAGSFRKYDAQIFVTVGEDQGQHLASLAYAGKMEDNVPTLIYHYKNAVGVPELLKVINGSVANELRLLDGKQNVRTYILGHGDHNGLEIGGGSALDDEKIYISYPEVYAALDGLWKKLSPNSLAKFTKLSILGCQLAAPPTRKDENGRPIKPKSNDWDTYFGDSFLGKLSALFFSDLNSAYRNNLRISAFKRPTSGETGQTLVYRKGITYANNQRDKIIASWDSTGNNIVRLRRGPEIGVRSSGRKLLPDTAINTDTFFLPEEDLHENFVDDLALAITEQDFGDGSSADWRGVNIISEEEEGNNKVIVLQRNPEDGDARSSHLIWDIVTPGGNATTNTSQKGRLIRTTGFSEQDRLEKALDQLKRIRTNTRAASGRADRILALPQLAGMSTADKNEARSIISGLPDVDDNAFTATSGSIIKLRALQAQRVASLDTLSDIADLALYWLSKSTPEASKLLLSDEGVATWSGSGQATLNENRTKEILSGNDLLLRMRILGALLQLDDNARTPLMEAFEKSTDPVLQRVGIDIVKQRFKMMNAHNTMSISEKASGALNVYFTVTAIYSLVKNWHTSSNAQIGLDLTNIVGSNLAIVSSFVVTKSLQKATLSLSAAGFSVARSVNTVMRYFPGIDFILAGVTMGSIGLQWEDFWKSGANKNSYAYKALVANTVTTVAFTAAGLAVTGSYLAASLTTAVAGTVIESIAASAGPIGLIIAITGFVVTGVIQGSLILHEYGDYYDSVGEEIRQFFASWIGIETAATKKAIAHKALATAASAYQTALNKDAQATKNYMAAYYGNMGYRKVVTVDHVYSTASFTRRQAEGIDGIVFNNMDTTNYRTIDANATGDKGTAFVGLSWAGYSIPFDGDPDRDNLFDLRGISAGRVKGGKGNDQFLIDQNTGLSQAIDTGGGLNRIMVDAGGGHLEIRQIDGSNCELLFFDSGRVVNIRGSFIQLLVTNATRAGIDLSLAPNGIRFDVGGVEKASLKIRGGAQGNSFVLREGSDIVARGNDILFWDGNSNAKISLEPPDETNAQKLVVHFGKAYHQITAHRLKNDLILGCGQKKIEIKGLYLKNGALDASKFISFIDISPTCFTLNCLLILGSAPLSLRKLSKTIIFRKGSGGTAAAPVNVWADECINTYSFSKDAGCFKLNFFMQHLNQVLLETDQNSIRYKKKEKNLILDFGNDCLLNINGYFPDMQEEKLLDIWIKPSTDLYPTRLVLDPSKFDQADDIYQSFSIPVTDLPKAPYAEVIDINGLTTDIELDAHDYLKEGKGKIHISIPEWADPARLIQCRYGGHDLALYFADHESRKEGSLPPMLIIDNALFFPKNAFRIFLHQEKYKPAHPEPFILSDYPPCSGEHTIALSWNQPVTASIRFDESHNYYISVPARKANSGATTYYLELYVLEGACDLKVSSYNSEDYHSQYTTNALDETGPYIITVSITDIPGKDLALLLQVVASSDNTNTRYALKGSNIRGTSISDDYILTPEVTELVVAPTRLLGSHDDGLLDATDYPVTCLLGGKATVKIDLDRGTRYEWLIDNTAVDTNSDRLLLTGNYIFSELEFFAAGPDLGLLIPIDKGNNQKEEKLIWFKDNNTNPAVRNLIVQLTSYATQELSFALPIADPSSGCFILPASAHNLAITGKGTFILDMDYYSENVTTIFIPHHLFGNRNEIVYNSSSNPLKPYFIEKGEQTGYDLRINQGELTLYIINYYRKPEAIRFCLVDYSQGSKSYQTLADQRQSIVFPNKFMDPIKIKLSGNLVFFPLKLLVPAITEGVFNIFDDSVQTITSPVQKLIFLDSFDFASSSSSAMAMTAADISAYLKMYGISAFPFDLPPSPVDHYGRAHIRTLILLNIASKGNFYSANVYVFYRYYSGKDVFIHVSPRGWLKTIDDARYAIALCNAGVNAKIISYAYMFKLTLAQAYLYSQKISGENFDRDEFARYASFVSGIRSIKWDGEGEGYGNQIITLTPAPLPIGWNTASTREQTLLTWGLIAKGFLPAKAELMATIARQAFSMTYDMFSYEFAQLLDLKDGKEEGDAHDMNFLLRKGVTALDIETSKRVRTRYESGNRNDLITVTVSEGLGGDGQASYRILGNARLTNSLKLETAGSSSDFKFGTLTTANGLSPLPGLLLEALRAPALNTNTILLARIYEANKTSDDILKVTVMPAGTSWYGRSVPDNIVNGVPTTGELHSWRAAIRYDKDGKAIPTRCDTVKISFTFKHKIILKSITIATAYEKAITENYSRYGEYQVAALDGEEWTFVSGHLIWTGNDDNMTVPIETLGVPYSAYVLIGVRGNYDHDRWIKEVTFVTADV
ncbi:hypothetical protein [Taibaiella helva]|uniref:hypothetical protein n=1 Tax=Taibaiella helva TaxID=2301235 RepID=UPI000E5723C2|nr:hypothetical protein [Taibaiella helva]